MSKVWPIEHIVSEWYCGFSVQPSQGWCINIPVASRNWFHQCLNLPWKFAYMMSCRKRKLNCLKVDRFYWLLLIETRQYSYCIKVLGAFKGRVSSSRATNPLLSLSHQEWHPTKETDEKQPQRCCWAALNSFSAHSITAALAGWSCLQGSCLASLTAGSWQQPILSEFGTFDCFIRTSITGHTSTSWVLSTCFHAIEVICTSQLFSLLSIQPDWVIF